MVMKRLFKGGIIVSGEGQKKLDILVKGEKILAVGENLEFRDAEIEDVRGKYLFPGFIDAHTHMALEVSNTITAEMCIRDRTGSPEPIAIHFVLINGNSWSNVDSADTISAAWISITESLSDRPPTPATMIAGVTQPTIIATTCWRARGKACLKLGTPLRSNIVERVTSFFMRLSPFKPD